ncbi:hypothetical protein F5884DRAFT_797594 [Xylogone sp. PMI_703]|nr:hypothetical protein F5884DRAFT_797594 [Xylogone sp. PMI_703]
MTSVFRNVGLSCRFGGANTPTSWMLRGLPDILCMTDNGAVGVAGEVKTPWVHDLQTVQQGAGNRHVWQGQIGHYMFATGCRYGFFTTYDQAIIRSTHYGIPRGSHLQRPKDCLSFLIDTYMTLSPDAFKRTRCRLRLLGIRPAMEKPDNL